MATKKQIMIQDLMQELNDVDRLQSHDVLAYLTKLKRLGHRGQTSLEIVFHFNNIIGRISVLNQLKRLISWKAIRAVEMDCRGGPLILYEVI